MQTKALRQEEQLQAGTWIRPDTELIQGSCCIDNRKVTCDLCAYEGEKDGRSNR